MGVHLLGSYIGGITNFASFFSIGIKLLSLRILRVWIRSGRSPKKPATPTSIFLPGCASLNRWASGQRCLSTTPKAASSSLMARRPNLLSKSRTTFASRGDVTVMRKVPTKGIIEIRNDSSVVHGERFTGVSAPGMRARRKLGQRDGSIHQVTLVEAYCMGPLLSPASSALYRRRRAIG